MNHTIILASYNRPRFIAEAIASVLEQTLPSWKLIISDDGSTPGTLDSIRAASKADQRIKVLTFSREQGSKDRFQRHVDATNRALAVVDRGADLIHYLADDDRFVPKRLERFEEMFSQRPEAMCCYGRLIYTDLRGMPVGSLYHYDTDFDVPLNNVDQGQFAHRRQVLDTFPRWDAAVDSAADGHWMSKLYGTWGRFRGFDLVVVKKRMHNRNMQCVGGDEREKIPTTPPISEVDWRRYED